MGLQDPRTLGIGLYCRVPGGSFSYGRGTPVPGFVPGPERCWVPAGLSSDDVCQETSARCGAVEPSSGLKIIPRWARPGL